MKFLPLLWAGIWRKRGRTFLMLLQIIFAFALFGLLQGVKSGIDQSIRTIDADLYFVQRASGFATLPLAQLTRIQGVAGVQLALPQSVLPSTYQNPRQQVFVVGYDVPRYVGDIIAHQPEFHLTPGALETMAQHRDSALVGVQLAARYHWKVGDRIPLQTGVMRGDGSNVWTFQIAGLIYDPAALGDDESMIASYDYMNEARAGEKNQVQAYIVRMKDPTQAAITAQKIDALFSNSADETRTESMAELAQSQLQQLGDINFVVRAIVAAVMFALLFSVGAMMMHSLRERTPELAVLKTLGFSDRRVTVLIVLEAAVTCITGALAGLWLASVVIPSARRVIQLSVRMPISVVLAGVLIAVVVAALSVALPAWRGSRLQISDALAGR